ncbi:MAG: ribosome maturation factor RimP [Acidiferrobacterales bacterium]
MHGGTAKLRAILEPVVEALGFDLVDVELAGGSGNALLRVYIDSLGGVTVDDCANVSRQVSAVLDVEDPISGRYTLEVSSPGLDRPLVKREDFQRFTGEVIKVRMSRPVLGRRNFTGRLVGVEGESIVLEMDAESFGLALADIDKARLVPKY